MTTATLTKENISLGLAYSSEVQSIIVMGRKHESMQADMVSEKELRALHLDPHATESTLCIALGIA